MSEISAVYNEEESRERGLLDKTQIQRLSPFYRVSICAVLGTDCVLFRTDRTNLLRSYMHSWAEMRDGRAMRLEGKRNCGSPLTKSGSPRAHPSAGSTGAADECTFLMAYPPPAARGFRPAVFARTVIRPHLFCAYAAFGPGAKGSLSFQNHAWRCAGYARMLGELKCSQSC